MFNLYKTYQTALIIAFCLFISNENCYSQNKESISAQVMRFIIEDGDTVFTETLPPAIKFPKPQRGKKGKAWRQYYRLVHNFGKTYPYALLAKEKIQEADHYLENHKLNARQKENYLKNFEYELFQTFEKPLRNLTFTQGRLLLRLIERETGRSSYYIIKIYRNGAAAIFWQGVAKIFGSDLKKPYNKFGEDKDTEELVAIYQKGQFNFLYISIFGKLPPKPITSPKKDYQQSIPWE